MNRPDELDEARGQLAALHAAASGVQSAGMRWATLDAALANTAAAAKAHEARVRAEVIAEVLGLYDGTNGCAAADLTPVIEAAQALDRRVRAEELRNAAKVAHDYGAEGHDERMWANDAAAEIEDRLHAAADNVESGGASTQAAPDLRAIYAKMRQHLNSALGEYHDTADLNATLALLDEAEKEIKQ